MLTDQEVINLIDGLCLSYENSSKTLKNAETILGEIYRVAHSHVKKSSCYHCHGDWRNESVELLKVCSHFGMC